MATITFKGKVVKSGLSDENKMTLQPAPLTTISPSLRYNLMDDGFGNLHRVTADAWTAALYFARGY